MKAATADEKRMNSLKTCLLIAIATCSGCAAIKHNVVVDEPTDRDAARVRVLMVDTPFASYRGVRAYPNSKCASLSVPGNGVVVSKAPISFEKNLNGKRLDMPATRLSQNTDNVSAEIYANANQPIVFGYASPADNRSDLGCDAMVYFYPERNGDYELVFGMGGKCKVALNKLDRAGNGGSAALIGVTPLRADKCK